MKKTIMVRFCPECGEERHSHRCLDCERETITQTYINSVLVDAHLDLIQRRCEGTMEMIREVKEAHRG